MAVLTTRELTVIDKIKKLVKTATNRDKLIREALVLLKTVVPFNSAVFFDVNPDSLEFTGALLESLDGDFLSQYFQNFHKKEDTVLCIREFLKKGYDSKRSSELIAFKPYTSSHWRTESERDFLKKHPEIMRIIAPSISQSLNKCQPDKTIAAGQTISEEGRLLEIINKRSSPGVLILDHNNRLLYKNEEAQTVLYLLSKNWIQSSPPKNERPGPVPVDILKLCDKLRATSTAKLINKTEQIDSFTSTVSFGSEVYSLRALLLDRDIESNDSAPIVVLIENISPAQRFDLEKARDRYQLTFKEKEVVQLLFQGFTNKEVAKELCIGAYTLKDHMRNIRQKMGACTRTGILSKVLQY